MIVGTFNKIPKSKNGHSYGWAKTWSENLGIPLDTNNGVHTKAYLLHGANFGGTLNLFGGFTPELKSSIDNLMLADEIISLDIDMPEYGEMLKNRKDVEDKEWCDKLTEKLSTATTLISSDLPFDTIAVGDSHTAAYSKHNSGVVKQDGTTLFGQVKTDFEYIRSHIKPHHKNVTISLGNIDIRHHICRVGASIPDMIDAYSKFVNELESQGLYVEVGIPWPIEFEGRKLPKTGYYKDQPFWGTREERIQAVAEFKESCVRNGLNLVECPLEWYSMNPKTYADTKMEARQSVHLNPDAYRRNNWGILDNSLEDFFG